MKYINLCQHEIRHNDGRVFPPSGVVARVAAGYSDFDERGVCRATFGEVTGLPDLEPGTIFIVSGMVSGACPGRPDVVAPATGHPDCVRKEGQVYSVPGFVK